jgi:aldehyde:ferredoxin oxidoreductase
MAGNQPLQVQHHHGGQMSLSTRKILRVNLSTGRSRDEEIPEKTAHDFVGGRGLAVRYLQAEVDPAVDPLSEGNRLILGAGPLAGTNAQSVSRWIAVTKSPLTGFFARSIGGADFGAWLRFAGYELIIIEGKADRLSYLHLDGDGSCRILDAAHLKGMDTQVTQARIIGPPLAWPASGPPPSAACALRSS